MTQKEAMDILKMGHNAYLTGQAGSGKTYLLRQYIDYLRKNNVDVAITASTGVAATHMNGITIHSWSGLGIRDNLTEKDLEDLESRKYLWDRIKNTKVLIIDEVSMLHHFRLDLVDRLVRTFKRSGESFGGMQVILCGDFFQLPPIARRGEREAKFVYESNAWKTMDLKICYLEEQFRQKDDDSLKVFRAIRSNNVDEETYSSLKSRFNAELEEGVEPTRLYTHNIDVDSINSKRLDEIDGELMIFNMEHSGRENIVETLKKSCLAPERLELKKGASVMFVKNNFEEGYVNGTLGKVVGFEETLPVVETLDKRRIVARPQSWIIEEEGKIKAEISQVPLRLAWAITIHKSQGMSLDSAEIDLSKSFETGMGYVALSRVRSLKGLRILGLNDIALRVNDSILEFDKELQELSNELILKLEKVTSEELARFHDAYIKSIMRPKGEEKPKKIPTHEITKKMALDGFSIKDIADSRRLTKGTVITHLEKAVEEGSLDPNLELSHLKPKLSRFSNIKRALESVGSQSGPIKLTPAKKILGDDYDFDEIKLARIFI